MAIVVIYFRIFVFESDKFEALTTEMAPMNRSFSHNIVHAFVSIGIFFGARAHTDDTSPGRVRAENNNGVVDSTELSMDSVLHFMPLVHIEGISSKVSGKVHVGVTMHAVWTFRKRSGVVSSIQLEETAKMTHGNVDCISETVKHGEVASTSERSRYSSRR